MTAALRLASVRVRDFRNLHSLGWERAWRPHPRFNVLWGDNGQGKSNLLEALYLVGSLRSFRGARGTDLIRWGATESAIDTRVAHGDDVRRYELALAAGTGRVTVRVDGKRPATASDYFGQIQMVLFHPGDVEVVRGAPESRRRWLDRLLYQRSPGYADDHRRYGRALRSRNKLLGGGASDDALEAWEGAMAPVAARLCADRAQAVHELADEAARAHQGVAGEGSALVVRYRPSVSGDADALRARWRTDRAADRAMERTRAGPQRDDVDLVLGDRSARGAASQGQQRSIALALKLAELSVLRRMRDRTPVLLLDDVSSELDPGRNESLFAALAESGGQVFVTTTRREYVRVTQDREDFEVLGGVLKTG